ncbi:MAG: transporter substrate-binding domain-containing protein, partial [Sulfurospirillaceae bacterium]|nr:transporter substrate-binding domain-containing protein [Sulfurospirillaceae bacterium]
MRNTLLCICIVIFLPLYLFGVELTSQERDYLQRLVSIKVCVDPDWAPFETLSAKGEYVGIGADLLFLVAQRLGLNVEILHTKDWDETMIASKEGKCQIMSFLNQTPARDKWLIFTEPHFSDPTVFITREEHPFIADPSEIVDK